MQETNHFSPLGNALVTAAVSAALQVVCGIRTVSLCSGGGGGSPEDLSHSLRVTESGEEAAEGGLRLKGARAAIEGTR